MLITSFFYVDTRWTAQHQLFTSAIMVGGWKAFNITYNAAFRCA